MSDTWAGILAISVAVMALMQVATMIGLLVVARKLTTVAQNAKTRIDTVATDVQAKVADVHGRVNAVVGDVRHATQTAQQMVGDARDRVLRMENAVRSAGQRVVSAVENVPAPVKRGVPAAVAALAAYRTFRSMRNRAQAQVDEDVFTAT
jgi:uncharacterized protein YoxC